MSEKLTVYWLTVHGTTCRNIEMASHCFCASHPITMYDCGHEIEDFPHSYEIYSITATIITCAMLHTLSTEYIRAVFINSWNKTY
jgi:hypothetical protein